MKAKDTSHIGMIVGAVGLIATFVVVLLKFILHNTCPSVEDVKALILIGVAPSIPFCPIFISTWFDKIITPHARNKLRQQLGRAGEIIPKMTPPKPKK